MLERDLDFELYVAREMTLYVQTMAQRPVVFSMEILHFSAHYFNERKLTINIDKITGANVKSELFVHRFTKFVSTIKQGTVKSG